MQAINVFENGIGYLAECLNLYLGGRGYLVLFICAVLYIFLKGDKEQKEIFIPSAIVLMCTVYNPLMPVVVDKFFDISSEYYRLFWIAPVIILVPFVVSDIVINSSAGKEKIAAIVFVVLVLCVSGDFVYKTGMPVAQNIYKVNDELIEVSTKIHEDSESVYPKVFLEYEYNMEMRQYDPKILLTVDREEYLYAVSYSYTDDMLTDDAPPVNRILAALVRNQKVDETAFRDSLEATKTEYVVLTKGSPAIELLERTGLKLIGSTDVHCIYKYDVAEPVNYELIDYSDVEHKFSYRRLK